jgi:hypothetical protein
VRSIATGTGRARDRGRTGETDIAPPNGFPLSVWDAELLQERKGRDWFPGHLGSPDPGAAGPQFENDPSGPEVELVSGPREEERGIPRYALRQMFTVEARA